MRTRWTIAAAAFSVAAAVGSSTAAISSANPSEAAARVNGRIAYGQFDPEIEAYHLFTTLPDGTDVHDLGVNTDGLGWSPDGSKILLTDLETGQSPLRPATLNPDGSGFTRLDGTANPLLDLGCGAWSPDGARLACEGFNDDHPELDGLYTVRATDGGGLVRVTDRGIPYDYSPDGMQIVFGRGGALFVVNTDGTGLRRITPGTFVTGDLPGGSWSPDGRWILFGTRGNLFEVHPDGTALRQIPLDDGPGRSAAFSPGWSPDGTRIVFSMAWKATDYQVDIFTARTDGTHLVQVTNTPEDENDSDWGTYTE